MEAETQELKAKLSKSQPRLIVGDGNQLTPQHNSVEDDQRTVGRGECDPYCSSKTGNHLPLQQNSKERNQLTEGSCEPGASNSPDGNWEPQGARPKCTQTQCPVSIDDQRSHNANLITVENLLPMSGEFDSKHASVISPRRRDIVLSLQESVRSQICYSSELEEELKKLKEQLRESKAEENQLRDKLRWYHSQGDKEKPGGKLPLVSRVSTNDESRQDASSGLYCLKTNLDRSRLVEGAFLKRQPDKRRGVQERDGEDDRAAESFGAFSANWGYAPGLSLCSSQRHVLGNGGSALIDEQRSYNSNLDLESQFGEREQGEGSLTASCIVVGSRDFPLPFTVPSHGSNIMSAVLNSATPTDDGNEETSLSPASSEVESKDTSSNRDDGTNNEDVIENSLAASEQSTAEDASSLVSYVLRRREESMKKPQRKDQMLREEQESEREQQQRESDKDGEIERQEAETWPPRQGGVSTESLWLCEHYQRRCRVRFPCCKQFYPCHRCHNGSSNCKNDKAKACHATHLKCSLCLREQEIDESSNVCRGCGEKMAAYFCAICKQFTGVDKNPYHCDQCGICRIHKDKSYHCKVCNVCLDKRLEKNHTCRLNAGHDKCFICLEVVFSRPYLLPCSHVVHLECREAMRENGIHTCPGCRRPLRTPSNEPPGRDHRFFQLSLSLLLSLMELMLVQCG